MRIHTPCDRANPPPVAHPRIPSYLHPARQERPSSSHLPPSPPLLPNGTGSGTPTLSTSFPSHLRPIRHHQHLRGAARAKRARNRGDSSWLTSSYLPSRPAHVNQITCQWGNGPAHVTVELRRARRVQVIIRARRNSCMSYRMRLRATGSVLETPTCQLRDRARRGRRG
ncbi:hypothetical protein EI94DRAFT_1739308 [Lactarius quietus]|nr:hypothetical protein EI94DRAFT_1739308 [Lactarius quietus]